MKSQAWVIEPAAAAWSATARSAAAAASRSTSTARGWPTTSSQTVIGPRPGTVRRRHRRAPASRCRAGPRRSARRRARHARHARHARRGRRARRAGDLPAARRVERWAAGPSGALAVPAAAGSRRAADRLRPFGPGAAGAAADRPLAPPGRFGSRRRTLRGEPGGQPLADRGPHDGRHRLRVPARVDDQVVVGRRVGQRPERPPHPLVEVDRLPLQPVRPAPGGPGPRQPDFRVDVQQHGQVGAQPAGRPPGQPPDVLDGQGAAGSLVGQRRVHVPVGDDDLTPVQRGPDDRVHVVGAVGGEQQRLRAGGERAVTRSRAGCCAPWRRSPSRRARG